MPVSHEIIYGRDGGALVERTTRLALLRRLPGGQPAVDVADQNSGLEERSRMPAVRPLVAHPDRDRTGCPSPKVCRWSGADGPSHAVAIRSRAFYENGPTVTSGPSLGSGARVSESLSDRRS